MSPFLYKWLKYSLLALVAGGFVALAIYALIMRDDIKNAQIEPPLIEAPEQALKTRPEAPGGLEFPNQDKLVFDLLEGSAPAGVVGASAMENDATGAAAASSFASPTAVVAETSSAASISVTAALPTEAVKPEAVVEAVKPAVAPKETPKVAEVKPEPKAEPKPEPKAEPKTETPKLAGSWAVQLAAVGSKADGDKVAKQLQGKFSALQPLKIRIVPAPDGTRYRVQFVGLATRTAAQAVCDKLGSQPCFPVGK